MFSNEYYSGTFPMNTCFYEKKHHKHHHKHSCEENPEKFFDREYFTPGPAGFPHTAPGNNVFFTLLIIALIFLVKNKSRLYA